jgi:hypothetical protein
MRKTLFTGLLLICAAAVAADLNWHKDVKGRVDEGTKLAESDPVSAYLLFKDVQEGTRRVSPEQKAWLDTQMTALEPRAAETLQRDYAAAVAAKDARAMLLIAGAGERMKAGVVKDQPSPEELRKRLASQAAALWNVTGIEAKSAKSYSESGGMAFSVILPPKHKILRVKAHVENVSAAGDPPYILWGLGSLKRVLGTSLSAGGNEPRRWLDDTLISLVTPSGELIGAAAMADGSDLASIKVRTAGSRLVYPPKALKKGDSVVVDAVFPVPEEPAEYRLLIAGAPPATVPAPTP